ncbi:MAG: F0F1 ATP synthase subunit delta, partial [Moraxellaceae bacterium]|nr:F0F1 ATP synthase subunit delta [Moraxellaceae bacterium]
MAEITTVARPYAKAAFQYAQEKSRLGQWAEMLGLLADVVSDSAFRAFLAQPELSSNQQAEAVRAVCGDKIDSDANNFVMGLASNKRLEALPAIRVLFDEMRAEAEGELEVDVTAAFPLSATQTQSLAATLTEKLTRQVNLTCSVDPSLIGGAVIRAGDLVIDASVRGKLGKLGATLN